MQSIHDLENKIETRIEELDLEYSDLRGEVYILDKQYDEFEIVTYSQQRDVLEWKLEMVSRVIMELENLLK